MAKKKNKKSNILAIIIVILVVVYNIYTAPDTEDTNNPVVSPKPNFSASVDNLVIHYIDVGQADSALITLNDKAMLIDAGDSEDDKLVVNYLKAQGITKLDYVVATHPHEDHIGGMDSVIRSFEIDTFLMPNVVHDSPQFDDMVTALEDKNLKFTSPKVGNTYTFGEAKFTILSCKTEDVEDLNASTIVLRLEYGTQSYIFCGDAIKENEYSMMDSGLTLKSTVIKIAHHGSTTSSLEKFILAVDPEIAVIPCGEGNSYGHPHEKIVKRLNRLGIKMYRTDLNGTIIVTSDGVTTTVTTEKGE